MSPVSAYSIASVIHAMIMKDVIASPCFVVASNGRGENHTSSGTTIQRTRRRLAPREKSARLSMTATGVVTSVLKVPPSYYKSVEPSVRKSAHGRFQPVPAGGCYGVARDAFPLAS